MTTEIIPENPKINALIKQVEQLTNKPITIVQTTAEKCGFVRHDQGQLKSNQAKIILELSDATKPDYLIAHELLHTLFVAQPMPKISYPLTTGNEQLDLQLMAAAQELYDIIAHSFVYHKQAELGLLDDESQELFFAGILATLKPEKTDGDGWMVLRVLNLLDVLLFADATNPLPAQLDEKFTTLYPKAFAAAKQMFARLKEKGKGKVATSPLHFRRSFAALSHQLDVIMGNFALAALHVNVFAAMTPVLSDRQLRLSVNQTFVIMHSYFTQKAAKEDAYVAHMNNDDTTSFVLVPPKVNADAYFRQIYAQPLGQFLSDHGIAYLKR